MWYLQLRLCVAEREQVVKRSCAFCQSDQREALEGALLSGEISQKELDRDMGWRANDPPRLPILKKPLTLRNWTCLNKADV